MAVDPIHHIGLLYRLAINEATRRGGNVAELVSHGAAGLIRSCRTYAPAADRKTSVVWIANGIRQAMFDGLVEHSHPMVGAKRTARWKHGLVGMPREGFFDPVDRRGNVGDRIERQDTRRKILQSLRRLNCKPRMAVLLYYFRGWDMPQIARRFGTSRQRIKQVIDRALRTIKPDLSELANE